MSAEADPGARLLSIASGVADEQAVDWQEARRSDPGLIAEIGALERLQVVAAAFRDARQSSPESGAEEMLFAWGHLEVREQIGSGSYGEVYRAWDPILAREVAIKLRRLGPESSRSSGRHYIQEARRLARVRHLNVLSVFGADLHDGRIGMWTELVRGSSLEERLAEEGPLGPREALAVGVDLCRALAAVHGSGLVHGDVKAANVLREEGGRIVLADFGAGSELGAGDSAGGLRRGTPLTTAPEVLLSDRVGPRADLYSLGVLLYRLVSGAYPVEARDLGALLALHREGQSRPLRDLRPDLPASFVSVVERALAPDPSNRFGSAGAMERALLEAMGDWQEEGKTALSTPPSLHRGGVLAWTAMAASAALLLLGAWWWLAGRGAGVAIRGEEAPVAETAGDGSTAMPSSPPVDAVAHGDSALETVPVVSRVTMFVARRGERRPLGVADRIAPGDQLSLELETTEEAFLYVLNEDAAGEIFVLFPLTGVSLQNPLAALELHRLPAADRDWQVTSAGETEVFLVVAARERLVDVESMLASLQAASEDRPVEDDSAGEVLRGVGGLSPATGSPGRLGALEEDLRRRAAEEGSIWMRRFEVRNPRPGSAVARPGGSR